MHPVKVLVPFASLATSALLLSACGSSGGGSGSSPTAPAGGSSATSSPTTSTPTSSTPTSSAAPEASAPTQAQLAKVVLQPGDLPGYEATPATPDTSDDSDLQGQLASCAGQTGAPKSHKVATAQSSDFQQGVITISSEFSSYQSADDVKADVSLLQSPKINTCINTAIKAALAKSAGAGTTVDSATLKLTPGSGGGPSNVAALAAGQVTITVSGRKVMVYLGVAFVTGPQLDGTLTFIGLGKPLDTATQTSALAAVAKRAANP